MGAGASAADASEAIRNASAEEMQELVAKLDHATTQKLAAALKLEVVQFVVTHSGKYVDTVAKVRERLEKEFEEKLHMRSIIVDTESFFKFELDGEAVYEYGVEGDAGPAVNRMTSTIIPEEEGAHKPKGKLFREPTRFECDFEYNSLSTLIRENLGWETAMEEE